MPDLIYTAEFLSIDSMLKELLRKLCDKIPSQSSKQLENLFIALNKQNSVEWHQNALFHCIHNNPPSKWNLRQDALKRRNNLIEKCSLSRENYQEFKLADMNVISNATPECLKYIHQNKLEFVLNPNLKLFYYDLQRFKASLHALSGMDFYVKLQTGDDDDFNVLIETLKQYPRLNSLKIDFSKCMIDLSQIPEMPKLQELIISNSELSNIAQFLKKTFPELIILSLVSNQITEFGYISRMPKLEYLTLFENQLTDVSELLSSYLPEIRTLILSYNTIDKIGRIDSMPKLENLFLQHNRLTKISDLIQSPLQHLTRLVLNHNQIKTVEKIECMSNLKELHLEDNELSNVSGLVKSSLSKLKKLTLNNNRFYSIGPIKNEAILKALIKDEHVKINRDSV